MYGLGFGYNLYLINFFTGNLTQIGASLPRPAGLAFTNVPEPNFAGVCVLVVGIVAAFRRNTR